MAASAGAASHSAPASAASAIRHLLLLVIRGGSLFIGAIAGAPVGGERRHRRASLDAPVAGLVAIQDRHMAGVANRIPRKRPRDWGSGWAGRGAARDHVPVAGVKDRVGRGDHLVAGGPPTHEIVAGLLPGEGHRSGGAVAPRLKILRRPGRAGVGAVVGGVSLVVVERPPLVVRVTACRDTGVPQE